MSIVSYSQNLEDVMLWRALKDVKNGFYIDIGANHPTEDSVTKLFYDLGWKGINVEPEEKYYELLKVERLNDINVNVAINSTGEPIEFYISAIRGWSTTNKDSSVDLVKRESLSRNIVVPAMTLDQLCSEYAAARIVHFLKIDVEGAEKDVLEGFSFEVIRPWIIIVEATKPTTQVDVSHQWENILYDNKYEFVYFDGLNKYYVASEREELKEKFLTPPNIFDDYMVAGEYFAKIERNRFENELEKCHQELARLKNALDKKELAIQEEMNRASIAEARINEFVNSTSWKLTSPLRAIVKVMKK
ncbi:FkbM family methyltransferase [Salinivibrio sp. IB643]|uniref:FkbM family methyltransferase n=1 Tax=Salinivibrio sp. IB643 TaxID=1909445 RepID=UPI000988FF2C|nr:FkbM family methyltransferase [Salinivibrio sp. IB643]OOE95376.1 hypothetical protein BZG77_13485 [Salinivibrio sp. IB643]